jgi:hypothetical protein
MIKEYISETTFCKVIFQSTEGVNFANQPLSLGCMIFFCLFFLRSNLGFDIAISSAKIFSAFFLQLVFTKKLTFLLRVIRTFFFFGIIRNIIVSIRQTYSTWTYTQYVSITILSIWTTLAQKNQFR